MRVTYLITGLGTGGAEVQVCTLAAGFAARGAEVRIVSMLPKIAEHPQLASGVIQVSTLGMTRGRWKPADVLRYVKTIRAHRPDIVHSHLFHANLLARVGRPFTQTPLVCTAHNTAEQPEHAKNAPVRTRFRELAYRLTDPLCNLTTQVSAEGAQRYITVRATPASKMQFVPNAVDCERFRPDPELRAQVRQELGLGDAFTWIWIGRIEEQKDPWTLLEAFKAVTASGDHCALLVVGTGSLEGEVRERAAALGVASRVHFLGLRRDIPKLLTAADAFVLSSIREGFPMVLLEAGAAGLPLVATTPGAEAVLPGKSGWVVAIRDPAALAERMSAVVRLLPDQRRALGAEARSFVLSKFALNAVVDRWERVYTSLLQKRRSKAPRVRPSA